MKVYHKWRTNSELTISTDGDLSESRIKAWMTYCTRNKFFDELLNRGALGASGGAPEEESRESRDDGKPDDGE